MSWLLLQSCGPVAWLGWRQLVLLLLSGCCARPGTSGQPVAWLDILSTVPVIREWMSTLTWRLSATCLTEVWEHSMLQTLLCCSSGSGWRLFRGEVKDMMKELVVLPQPGWLGWTASGVGTGSGLAIACRFAGCKRQMHSWLTSSPATSAGLTEHPNCRKRLVSTISVKKTLYMHCDKQVS